MKNQKLFLILLMLGEVSLTIGCFSGKERRSAYSEKDFYKIGDFPKVRKIDAHTHIWTADTNFIHQARIDNFRLLSIVVEESIGIQQEQKYDVRHKKDFPRIVDFATTVSIQNWGTPGWSDSTIRWLKKSFREGAVAVKFYKIIGMQLKDSTGRFVMINDPGFDKVFNFLEENQVPVIGHLGEPKNCWLPMDQMTMEMDKKYYSRHPEFYMYQHPEYPSYEDQINARDSLLMKHPELIFIGAHLGSLEWSTDELAKRLDEFPNMAVDVAARVSHLQYQAKKDWQKVHDFFMKYQDRIIYGTDRIDDGSEKAEDMMNFAHEAWIKDWRFFCTEDSLTSSSFEGSFKGLHLPRSVIDKLYYKNAEHWIFKDGNTAYHFKKKPAS